MLSEITKSARLTGYLCVKGLYRIKPWQCCGEPSSRSVSIRMYARSRPNIALFLIVTATSSAKAFRYTKDKALQKHLKEIGVQFRFMHCKAAKPLSMMYSRLSAYVVHGPGSVLEKESKLSCEFVDRGEPSAMSEQFQRIQLLMPLIYTELLLCIPEKDWLVDEVAPYSIASLILLPLLSPQQRAGTRN